MQIMKITQNVISKNKQTDRREQKDRDKSKPETNPRNLENLSYKCIIFIKQNYFTVINTIFQSGRFSSLNMSFRSVPLACHWHRRKFLCYVKNIAVDIQDVCDSVLFIYLSPKRFILLCKFPGTGHFIL